MKPGDTVSHYVLEERLGAGGMGEVWLARDTSLDRKVAIKFLAAKFGESGEAKERFLREAKAAARLDHPNVIPVHEFGEAEGLAFIVMAYLPGQSLRDVLESQEAPLPVMEVLRWGLEASQGLATAHKQGVVHRDIKPDNLLLTDTRQIRIADFGLAHLDTATQLTQTGTRMGTVAYMSPEQTQGRPTDHRSDIFSMGATLYEMLTGHLPFEAEDGPSMLYAIAHSEPVPITRHRKDIPPALGALVEAMLAKDPDRRPPSMETVAAELSRVSQGVSAGATVQIAPAFEKPGEFPWRRVLGIAAVLVVAVGIYFGLQKPKPRPVPHPGPSLVAKATVVFPFSYRGDEQYAYLGEGMVDLLSTTLDGVGDVKTVNPAAVLGTMREAGVNSNRQDVSPATMDSIALSLNAGRWVHGSIVEVGGKLRVTNVGLYETNSNLQRLADASAEGLATDVFKIVDALSGQLLIDDIGDVGEAPGLAAASTDTLPALKAYLEAERHARSGDRGEAIEAYREAVSMDSTFALAWYGLSLVEEGTVGWETAIQSADRALAHSDRLPEHFKDLMQANADFFHGRSRPAEKLCRKILETHPHEVKIWNMLGNILWQYSWINGGSISGAREAFEKVASYGYTSPRILLRFLAAYDGRWNDVDSLWVRDDPERQSIPWRAIMAFGNGTQEEQAEILAELSAPGMDVLAHFASFMIGKYTGHRDGSRTLLESLTEPSRLPDWRSLAHKDLAYLHLTEGRWKQAQGELEHLGTTNSTMALEHRAYLSLAPFLSVSTVELDSLEEAVSAFDPSTAQFSTSTYPYMRAEDGVHEQIRIYLLGLIAAKLGQHERALQHADELERLESPPRAESLSLDLANGIRAEVAVQQGNREEALRILEESPRELWYSKAWHSPFYSGVRERYLRADLLASLGRRDEALAWLKSLTRNAGNYDIPYRAPAYLKLAELQEQIGETENAAMNYRNSAALWSDCDFELRPLLQQGKERLAAIDSN